MLCCHSTKVIMQSEGKQLQLPEHSREEKEKQPLPVMRDLLQSRVALRCVCVHLYVCANRHQKQTQTNIQMD